MESRGSGTAGRSPLGRLLHENALSIVALALFLASVIGQAMTGLSVANDEAREHGAPLVSLGTYLASGDFLEALFENSESEFLQMGVFVLLTKFLRQRGSSESKSFEHEEVDDDPRTKRRRRGVPWPVARGGIVLAIYERSLSLALFAMFALSFALHAVSGAEKQSEEALRHGGHAIGALAYLGTAQFWFESFQNWQSEFLAVATLVLLSIVFRERGSPQSKPVASPHAATGG